MDMFHYISFKRCYNHWKGWEKICIIFIFSTAYLVTVKLPEIGEMRYIKGKLKKDFKKRFANVLRILMIFQGGVCAIPLHFIIQIWLTTRYAVGQGCGRGGVVVVEIVFG